MNPEQKIFLDMANSGMSKATELTQDEQERLSRRTTSEVFMDHLQMRKEGRLEDDLARNYADDVVIVSNYGTFHGKEGVRESASILLHNLPSLNYRFDSLLMNKSGAAFEEWSGFSDTTEVTDGIDAFIIKEGKIRVQTIWYTAHPKTQTE